MSVSARTVLKTGQALLIPSGPVPYHRFTQFSQPMSDLQHFEYNYNRRTHHIQAYFTTECFLERNLEPDGYRCIFGICTQFVKVLFDGIHVTLYGLHSLFQVSFVIADHASSSSQCRLLLFLLQLIFTDSVHPPCI